VNHRLVHRSVSQRIHVGQFQSREPQILVASPIVTVEEVKIPWLRSKVEADHVHLCNLDLRGDRRPSSWSKAKHWPALTSFSQLFFASIGLANSSLDVVSSKRCQNVIKVGNNPHPAHSLSTHRSMCNSGPSTTLCSQTLRSCRHPTMWDMIGGFRGSGEGSSGHFSFFQEGAPAGSIPMGQACVLCTWKATPQ
jgi:hypothetical protein